MFDEIKGDLTLILNGLSKSEALRIGNDVFGTLCWSKEEDGVVRAYPIDGDTPFEIRRRTNDQNTKES